jgi:hypothetical protein
MIGAATGLLSSVIVQVKDSNAPVGTRSGKINSKTGRLLPHRYFHITVVLPFDLQRHLRVADVFVTDVLAGAVVDLGIGLLVAFLSCGVSSRFLTAHADFLLITARLWAYSFAFFVARVEDLLHGSPDTLDGVRNLLCPYGAETSSTLITVTLTGFITGFAWNYRD